MVRGAKEVKNSANATPTKGLRNAVQDALVRSKWEVVNEICKKNDIISVGAEVFRKGIADPEFETCAEFF